MALNVLTIGVYSVFDEVGGLILDQFMVCMTVKAITCTSVINDLEVCFRTSILNHVVKLQ